MDDDFRRSVAPVRGPSPWPQSVEVQPFGPSNHILNLPSVLLLSQASVSDILRGICCFVHVLLGHSRQMWRGTGCQSRLDLLSP